MRPQEVKRVAVIGAGTMGHSIAQVFARSGIEVNLMDVSKDILDRALQLINANLKTLAGLGRLNSGEIPGIVKRIHPATDLAEAARGAEFVLEAVVEVPLVKEKVFRVLEESCPPGTVLASNTSVLELFNVVKFKDPSRIVIAHWFAPPHIIPLVEVVPGPETSPDTLKSTAGLMERIGKKPLIMKQFIQRFIVNRFQNVIVTAAMEMIENNWATPEEIDLAVKTSLGIRLPILGIMQSLDFNGLRIINEILKSQGRNISLIEEKVKQGHLGPSTSRGIYDYQGRTEAEILRRRDELFFKLLDLLETSGAFKPV